MIIPQTDQDNYRNSLQALYDLLNQAYWYATTIEAKDAINGLAQAIYGILTSLNQAALDTESDDYVTLKTTVDAVTTKMKAVQDKINDWIHAISIATQVVNAIDQVVNNAPKVFAVVG